MPYVVREIELRPQRLRHARRSSASSAESGRVGDAVARSRRRSTAAAWRARDASAAKTSVDMNAMNISILVLCLVVAGGIYWGGFAEERRANRGE